MSYIKNITQSINGRFTVRVLRRRARSFKTVMEDNSQGPTDVYPGLTVDPVTVEVIYPEGVKIGDPRVKWELEDRIIKMYRFGER